MLYYSRYLVNLVIKQGTVMDELNLSLMILIIGIRKRVSEKRHKSVFK